MRKIITERQMATTLANSTKFCASQMVFWWVGWCNIMLQTDWLIRLVLNSDCLSKNLRDVYVCLDVGTLFAKDAHPFQSELPPHTAQTDMYGIPRIFVMKIDICSRDHCKALSIEYITFLFLVNMDDLTTSHHFTIKLTSPYYKDLACEA